MRLAKSKGFSKQKKLTRNMWILMADEYKEENKFWMWMQWK
jgi:hypothetical protein